MYVSLSVKFSKRNSSERRHVVKNVDVFIKNFEMIKDWNDVHMYIFAKNTIATHLAMRSYRELTFFPLITLGVYNGVAGIRWRAVSFYI